MLVMYKDCNELQEMRGQQNIKFLLIYWALEKSVLYPVYGVWTH